MLSGSDLKKLAALGMTPDQIVAVSEMVEEKVSAAKAPTANALRQRRFRERNAHKSGTSVTESVTYNVMPSVTNNADVTPPRTPKRDNNNPPIVPPKAAKPKKAMIPAEWEPSPEHIAAAAKEGLSLDAAHREARKFRDYHRSKGTLFVDWMAAWRNWIRKAVEINPNLKKGQNPDRHWLADTPGYGFG